MRTKGLSEPFVLSELTIKLYSASGESVDTAYAMNVGVVVEFDYVPGDDIDAPQVKIKSVKSAGAALENENVTLNCWMGYDLLPYLPVPDVDLIEQAMLDKMDKAVVEHNDDMRISSRID